MTLPRRPSDESGYSKLDKSVMMKAGLSLECSALNGSQSSIENDASSQEVDEEPVQLIHAPNAPTAIIPMRPHDYEDLGFSGSDEKDTGMKEPSSTASRPSNDKPKEKITKAISSHLTKVFPKPETVTDEDYERRLDRLESHYYPEIDIPAWPDTSPTLCKKSPDEIKAVVRNSWAIPTKKEAGVNGDVSSNEEGLPSGWKREVNEQGQTFYWHLPTGNIQYTLPTASNTRSKSKVRKCYRLRRVVMCRAYGKPPVGA